MEVHCYAGCKWLRKFWFSHRRPLLKESFHCLSVLLEINRTTLFRIMWSHLSCYKRLILCGNICKGIMGVKRGILGRNNKQCRIE